MNKGNRGEDELTALPHLDATLAQAVIDEYRRYVAIEQFRREIGKYVDDDELARLERYVTLGDG